MLNIRSQLSCLERWSQKNCFCVCVQPQNKLDRFDHIYTSTKLVLIHARWITCISKNFYKIDPPFDQKSLFFSKVQLCARSKPGLWASSMGLISKSSPSSLLRWYKDKGIGVGVDAGHSVRQEGDISNPISINRLTDFNKFVLTIYFRKYEPCRKFI